MHMHICTRPILMQIRLQPLHIRLQPRGSSGRADGGGAVARGPGELEGVDEAGAGDDGRRPREVTAGALLLASRLGDSRGGEACLDPRICMNMMHMIKKQVIMPRQ